MPRPTIDEYADFYAGYIDRVPEEDAVGLMVAQLEECLALLDSIPDERWSYRYSPEKWSIAELVGHWIDTEWVFTARALWFARGASAPMPGMDPDEFVDGAAFESQDPAALRAQFASLRRATTALFASFSEAELSRVGTASGCRFTVRAVSFILVGHLRHHLDVLRTRYSKE